MPDRIIKLNALLVVGILGMVIISMFLVSLIIKSEKVIKELVVMSNDCLEKANGANSNVPFLDISKVEHWEQLSSMK